MQKFLESRKIGSLGIPTGPLSASDAWSYDNDIRDIRHSLENQTCQSMEAHQGKPHGSNRASQGVRTRCLQLTRSQGRATQNSCGTETANITCQACSKSYRVLLLFSLLLNNFAHVPILWSLTPPWISAIALYSYVRGTAFSFWLDKGLHMWAQGAEETLNIILYIMLQLLSL